MENILHAGEREGLRTHHVATRSHENDLIADRFPPPTSAQTKLSSSEVAPSTGFLISADISRRWLPNMRLIRLSSPFFSRGVPSAALLTRTDCLLVRIRGGSLKRTLFTSLMNAGGTFISLKPPLATPLVLSNLHSSLISRRERLTRTATSLSLRGGGGLEEASEEGTLQPQQQKQSLNR